MEVKTTWSELQKLGQTVAMQGEANLLPLYIKTTWSEFQKPRQTTPVFHPITSVGPKQLCVLANLGIPCAADTF